MKKCVISFFTILMVMVLTVNVNAASLSTTSAEAESYVVNDQQIEMLLAKSTDVSFMNASLTTNDLLPGTLNSGKNASFAKAGSKSAIAAIVIDLLVGGLGIHRAYLGTKTFTWVGYILTCGGIFGIVPLVDLVVLAINAGDISAYEDNSKFFMW